MDQQQRAAWGCLLILAMGVASWVVVVGTILLIIAAVKS